MKKLRKIFLLVASLLLALTISSCTDKEVRNTSIPMGAIDTQATVANSGDYTVNNEIYYNKLRSKGYDTVFNQIKIALFRADYDFVKSQINLSDSDVNTYEQKLFDAYASDIFSTSSAKTIKDLTVEQRDTYIEKYIDNSSNKGIFVTKENCLSYSIENEKIKFSYIPQEVIDEKLISIAMEKAAKDALEDIVDNEKIQDDEGKLVTNTNYISDLNISSYYESNHMTYGTYRAIIIQFNNLNEARNVIASVEQKIGALTEANALRFYVNLYNTYYNYRTPIKESDPFTSNSEDTKTVFVVNEDKDELKNMSSSIANIVTNTLEEDGQYLKQPFNQNNKYVMVYRGATEFDINETYDITPLNEQVKWTDLKEHETAFNEVKATVREKLIDSKASSYSSTLLAKKIKAAEIEIYDPYVEYRFKNSYDDDYELIAPSKFDENYIFKIKDSTSTYTYSVEEFYKEQSRISGLEVVVEILKLEYAYDLRDKFLDSDRISDLEEDLDKTITSFNKNENSAYPSSVGLEVYLLASFGYTSRENVLKYNKIGSAALSSYLNQKIFDEWAKKNEDGSYSHEIAYDKLNILENILQAGNANFENLFSINIDHMLIYIDDNSDGSPDDPKDFLKNFTESQTKEFQTALMDLANAIYEEANCELLTASNTKMEILQYIVSAYNKNEPLFSNPDVTWEKYKKYNFLIKAESLSSSGDTNQDNVGNYVKEFGDYVKKLYKVAKENKLTLEDEESTFYFVNSLDKAPAKYEDLCATQFGFHMIVINDYDETPSTTKNTEASDSYGYQKNIEILINELDKDTTDDNIYVVVSDTYNEKENEATMNQLFTYYVQTQSGATSTFDPTLRNVLSAMFGSAITRYTSSSFQEFLLFKKLNISAFDSTSILSKQLSNYEGYLIRTSQSYSKDDEFENWYTDALNWDRPYEK